jgi:hypothetical protein
MKSITSSVVAVVFAGLASAVCGETHTVSCYNAGPNPTEAVGDREGHFVQATSLTCREAGGIFDGVITTQNLVWEHDSTGSRLLSGNGVGRKPGGVAAFHYVEGVREPVMQDGKRVAWRIKGKGVFSVAGGNLAPLQGKVFNWMIKGGGPGHTEAETSIDD